MDFKQELAALLWANVPLVNLVTYEEERVARVLCEIEGGENLGVTIWDVADGFETIQEGRHAFAHNECTSDTVLPSLRSDLPILALKSVRGEGLGVRGE